VLYVDAKRVKVLYKDKKIGTKEYNAVLFEKSNQKTCVHQNVRVSL
jgi:DNA-directed RNA polymerase beta subunit